MSERTTGEHLATDDTIASESALDTQRATDGPADGAPSTPAELDGPPTERTLDPATAPTIGDEAAGAMLGPGALLDRLAPEPEGRYTTTGEELGRGGIGSVLLAADTNMGREVALKVLQRSSNSAQHARRFVREALVTGRLEHPGIVPVYELGRRPDGEPYYTMKVVRGRTLADAIGDSIFDARLELLNHFLDVCQALAYAHSRGVVHRDVKPANIMLGAFGETVLLDWGLAKVRGLAEVESAGISADVLDSSQSNQTVDGNAIGTPAYMSPEQANGWHDLTDARSDVWGLGVVLYELLSGETPFSGSSARAMLLAVTEADLTPVRDVEPRVPADLAAIVDKALQRDPSDRYEDAGAMADDVSAYLGGRRVDTYAYSSWELAKRFVGRNRPLSIAIGIILAMIVAGTVVVFGLYQSSEEARQEAEVAGALAESERESAMAALDGEATERTRAEALRQTAQLNLSTAYAEKARQLLAEHNRLQARVYAAAAVVAADDASTIGDEKRAALQSLYTATESQITHTGVLEPSGRQISALRFAPTDGRIALGDDSGLLAIYDDAGDPIVRQSVADVGISGIAWLDAETLAVVPWLSSEVRIQSADDLAVVDTIAASETWWSVRDVVASPDGEWLAVLTASGVSIFDLQDRRAVPAPRLDASVTAVAMSRRHLLLGTENGEVHAWRLPSREAPLPTGDAGLDGETTADEATDAPSETAGEPRPRWVRTIILEVSNNTIAGLAVRGEEEWLVTDASGGFAVYAIGDETPIHRASLPGASWVAVDPSGATVLVGTGAEARLIDARSWRVREVLALDGLRFSRASFRADGQRIVTGHDGAAAHVWATSRARASNRLDLGVSESETSIHDLRIEDAGSGNARRVVAATDAGGVLVWSLDKPSTPLEASVPDDESIRAVALRGDTVLAATRDSDGVVRLRAWSANGLVARDHRELGRAFFTGRHLDDSLILSADGERIAWFGDDHRLAVADTRTGEVLERLSSQIVHATALAISADGKQIAAMGALGYVTLWDLSRGRPVWRRAAFSVGGVGLGFAGNGTLLVAGSRDGVLTAWTTADGVERFRSQSLGSAVLDISGDRDATVLIGAADGTAQLVDLRTGASLARFELERAVHATARLGDPQRLGLGMPGGVEWIELEDVWASDVASALSNAEADAGVRLVGFALERPGRPAPNAGPSGLSGRSSAPRGDTSGRIDDLQNEQMSAARRPIPGRARVTAVDVETGEPFADTLTVMPDPHGRVGLDLPDGVDEFAVRALIDGEARYWFGPWLRRDRHDWELWGLSRLAMTLYALTTGASVPDSESVAMIAVVVRGPFDEYPGEPVPCASVELLDAPDAEVFMVRAEGWIEDLETTSGEGGFVVPRLPPGPQRVRVSVGEYSQEFRFPPVPTGSSIFAALPIDRGIEDFDPPACTPVLEVED